ncbi:uncharacterized protein LOC113668710 [Pocillopora damicornis]|uniref:SH3 domain-containing protein n=1 Tax=Pocillopora meandrina TaxID=46732 RepID=A0AAU9WEL8_9CNID|nr:uncharacterized protein LOC113668710 [Pocillopora damicornis]XP_058960696.1 uncharacterized protein LOC131787628 [Pocillopora verrucosa]CAH3114469.1 unnamed protein product [Pocillopora meandrina]
MEIYEAKYDFCDDCGESLLSFNKGEKFLVTNKSDGGWWAAQNLSSNEIGYIPSAYVECTAVIDPLTLDHMDVSSKQEKIKMDALCELTAKIQQNPHPGRNHPKYPKEDYLGDGKQTPPTTPELKRTVIPHSASKEQDELRKDLKFSQQRGIQLGRPELMKTWEKFEHKKSAKAEKGKSSVDSELESRFRSISQKQEDFEKQKETEATKPEFMRVSLKKSSREVEATS